MFRPVKFLVVDDDPSTVSAMRRLLESDGHHVAAYTAGAEAAHAMRHATFDAIVTDVDMPGADGFAVLHAAREHHPRACRVAVTGRAESAFHRLAAAGACIVGDKPVDYDTLTAQVTECRGRGRAATHGCWFRGRTDPPRLLKLRVP